MIFHHNVKHISKAYNKQIFEEKWKTTQYQFVDWSSPHLITEYLGYMLTPPGIWLYVYFHSFIINQS
jgi:hypothetical protein